MERCTGLGVPRDRDGGDDEDQRRPPARARPRGRGTRRRSARQRLQPSKPDRFSLSYTEFSEGFRHLLGAARLVATTGPGSGRGPRRPRLHGPACGRSTVRLAPDGRILPCRLLAGEPAHARGPGYARGRHHGHARVPGGDRAAHRLRQLSVPGRVRRAPRGARPPGGPDPYCPFARGDRLVIDWEPPQAPTFPSSGARVDRRLARSRALRLQNTPHPRAGLGSRFREERPEGRIPVAPPDRLEALLGEIPEDDAWYRVGHERRDAARRTLPCTVT